MSAQPEVVLEGKPDFEMAMKRIDAWYEGAMLDRPPVRFSRHNAEFEAADDNPNRWANLKDRWFDTQYVVDTFEKSIEGKVFRGETFPVFWPNLGPNVYAAFFGCELEYGEVTSWIQHAVHQPEDVAKLKFDRCNEYFQQIERMTKAALEACHGKYLVGYTDLHFGLDCVADWRGQSDLCLDLYDRAEMVEEMLTLASRHWSETYDHWDTLLKQNGQLSVTWMAIPSHGQMHISSCDFGALISPDLFEKFALPATREEVAKMTHNIYHLDGIGVARHLGPILEIPEIQAVQWVQGVGDDQPIMQWVDLLKRIRAAGKSVVVDLQLAELEPFIDAMDPEGVYLCIPSENDQQEDEILKRLKRW